jgi:hypothetical protein
MVLPALKRAGYQAQRRYRLPDPFRPGRDHYLDVAVLQGSAPIGIAAKWQQSSGTAEEKVVMEVLRLIKLVEGGRLDRGYVLLAGTGWSLRDYFLSGSFLKEFSSPAASRVRVVDLDALIALINRGRL